MHMSLDIKTTLAKQARGSTLSGKLSELRYKMKVKLMLVRSKILFLRVFSQRSIVKYNALIVPLHKKRQFSLITNKLCQLENRFSLLSHFCKPRPLDVTETCAKRVWIQLSSFNLHGFFDPSGINVVMCGTSLYAVLSPELHVKL